VRIIPLPLICIVKKGEKAEQMRDRLVSGSPFQEFEHTIAAIVARHSDKLCIRIEKQPTPVVAHRS
jgi:hypothetical protein